GSRLYAHRKVYSDVVEGIAEYARGIKLGPGLAPDSQMGPLVSKEQQDRVTSYIESGIREGAKVLAGGPGSDLPGYYVKPTILGGTRSDMKVVREESFGPVLSCASFEDLDEVVRQANDTRYGLAASIFSNNLTAVHRLIPRLKAGTVWVNHHNLL